MTSLRIGEERAEPPVRPCREPMRTRNEPGWYASRHRRCDLELHRDFCARIGLPDLVPFLLETRRVERQPLYNQTDVAIFERSVGEIEFFHQSQEMVTHSRIDIRPELVHMFACEEPVIRDHLFTVEHAADRLRRPLGI